MAKKIDSAVAFAEGFVSNYILSIKKIQ